MKKKPKIPKIENCPASDDYRTEISDFIGQNGTISGKYVEYNSIFKFGFQYNYEIILLKDVTAICNGKKRYTEHLWIKLPFSYCIRNKMQRGNIYTFTGDFYEYMKLTEKGYKKNVGFRRSKELKKESDLIESNFCTAVI